MSHMSELSLGEPAIPSEATAAFESAEAFESATAAFEPIELPHAALEPVAAPLEPLEPLELPAPIVTEPAECEQPSKRRRHHREVDCASFLLLDGAWPTLTPYARETGEHVSLLFREIEKQTGPARERRKIELIYYLLARRSLLFERPMFTQALIHRLLDWVAAADREMAILSVMSTLHANTIMPDQFQAQIVTVAHYEHIRDCGLRLIMNAKEVLKILAKRMTQEEHRLAQDAAIADIVANVIATLP
jgi:hypothetical protein